MKIYLNAPYTWRGAAHEWAHRLTTKGHTVVSRWVYMTTPVDLDKDQTRIKAEMSLRDLEDAEMIITVVVDDPLNNPHYPSQGGTAFIEGYSRAMNGLRRVIIDPYQRTAQNRHIYRSLHFTEVYGSLTDLLTQLELEDRYDDEAAEYTEPAQPRKWTFIDPGYMGDYSVAVSVTKDPETGTMSFEQINQKLAAETSSPIQDQPAPTPNDYPSMHDLACRDLQERKQVGLQRYGSLLQPFNGRDAEIDAYQEAQDLLVYLRQKIYETRGC